MLEETIEMKEKIQSIEGKSRTYWDKLTEIPFPVFRERPKPPPHLGRDHNNNILHAEEVEEEVEFEDADLPLDASKIEPETEEEERGEAKEKRLERGAEAVPSSQEVIRVVTPVKDPTLKPAAAAGRERLARSNNNDAEKKGVKKRKPPPKLASEQKWKLLKEAPFVEDPDKLHVPDGCDVLANSRGLEIEGHWGATDDSAVVPLAKLAMLHQKTSFYVAESSGAEISICGAKLSDGSFCQRRDKKICPFHGPIVARDSNGQPIDKASLSKRGRMAGMNNNSHFSSLKSQRDFDRDANTEILQELAGGKRYEMPSSSSKGGKKGVDQRQGKKKRKKMNKKKTQKDSAAPVSHRERIHEKLFNPKKNKLMKKLLSSMADIESRNRNANKW
jgi:hypothetical protein